MEDGKVPGYAFSIEEKEPGAVNVVEGIRKEDGDVVELGRFSVDSPRGKQHTGFHRLNDDKKTPPPPPSQFGDTATTASMSSLPPRRTGNFKMLMKELKSQGEFGEETARKRLKARVKKLKALDRVASIITVLQCSVIAITGALAATAAETAWITGDYESFVSTDWVTFCQSLTTLLSIASLLIFYIESRVEVIMRYPNKRWFWPWYFPSIIEACLEVVLYILHCPPMIFNVPLIVCTSLRMILLFRLCKLHPDVRSIRFNQIMTGECPSFSSFFFYKTVVRTSPLTAIFILAMITTPIILFIYLQTSRLDEGFSANPSTPSCGRSCGL